MLQAAPFADIRARGCAGGRWKCIDQRLDRRGLPERAVAKRLRRNKADQRLIAGLTQSLVREEEECAVLQHASAHAAAKLVETEWWQRGRIERTARVERRVARVLERRSVEGVRSRFGHHFNLTAAGTAGLSREQRAVDPEFRDRILGHQQPAVEPHVLVADARGIHSVDSVVHVVPAGREEADSGVAAVGTIHRAGGEGHQRLPVAAVHRQTVQLVRCRHCVDGSFALRQGVAQRLHLDRCCLRGNLQHYIPGSRFANRQLECLGLDCAEAWRAYLQSALADRQSAQVKYAGPRRFSGATQSGLRVDHRYRRLWHDSTRGVQDSAGNGCPVRLCEANAQCGHKSQQKSPDHFLAPGRLILFLLRHPDPASVSDYWSTGT